MHEARPTYPGTVIETDVLNDDPRCYVEIMISISRSSLLASKH
jgi:hypothetical protein